MIRGGACKLEYTAPPGLTIRRRLAVGGMAELFVAEQKMPDGSARDVVLKRALPGSDDIFLSLLAREREALAALSSPHVVELLGGTGDHLILEYVPGADLAAILAFQRKRGRTLPLSSAMAAINGLLCGLRDLHAGSRDGHHLGLVHRDVNPANLLVRAPDGAVKLTDLGVVRVSLEQQPTTGGLKGTLAYMAPEQLEGGVISAQTDLYAAGLVAYEALCGVAARPAGMLGLTELVAARRTLPAPPSTVNPRVPPELDAVILSALSPDPADRPATATAFLELLSPWLADQLLLGELAGRATTQVARVSRTEGVGLSTPERTAAPAAAPGVKSRILLATLAIAAGFATWWSLAATDPHEDRPSRSQAAAAGPIAANNPKSDSGHLVTATPRVQRAADGAHRTGRRAATPRAALPDGWRRQTASNDRVERRGSAAPARVRRPVPNEPTVPALDVIRLSIAAVGGQALHVTGPGLQGLAPGTTEPLDEGAHVLRLRGGSAALPATIRLRRRNNRLTATIGAPPGRWYNVTCGGTARGHTPVHGLPIGRRLTCQLKTEAGAGFGFALSRMSP